MGLIPFSEIVLKSLYWFSILYSVNEFKQQKFMNVFPQKYFYFMMLNIFWISTFPVIQYFEQFILHHLNLC